jgi:hypothetical protein
LDEYWRVIEENIPESPSSWNNVEMLEYRGKFFHAGGYTRHPSFIPFETKYGTLELWDKRGAPDMCNKSSGQWVCE